MSKIWHQRVCLNDQVAETLRKQRKLPDTFSSLCLEEKRRVRTAEEIESRFGLPREMAEQYAAAAPFFFDLRKIRDGIVHGGREFDLIFETERGFCVSPKSAPFSAFQWQTHHSYNENLVSLLPWLSHIILQTIGTCTALMSAFASLISLPEELAPGYRVFVRGPNNDALIQALEIQHGASPWWGPSGSQ